MGVSRFKSLFKIKKRDARAARLYNYKFMWVKTNLGNNRMLLNSKRKLYV